MNNREIQNTPQKVTKGGEERAIKMEIKQGKTGYREESDKTQRKKPTVNKN